MSIELNEIATIINTPLNEDNFFSIQRLKRIQRKLLSNATSEDVLAAERETDAEGMRAVANLLKQLSKSTGPVEKVYKIKRSLKGARVAVQGFEGRKFSFGPVWNDMVINRRGSAMNDRIKLNAQAVHLGIDNPFEMELEDLLTELAVLLSKD